MRGGLATRESPLQIGKRNKGNGNVAKEKDGWNLERYLTDTERGEGGIWEDALSNQNFH